MSGKVNASGWRIDTTGYGLTFTIELNGPTITPPTAEQMMRAFAVALNNGWRAQFLRWNDTTKSWVQRDAPTDVGWQGGSNMGGFSIWLSVDANTRCTPEEARKVLEALCAALDRSRG